MDREHIINTQYFIKSTFNIVYNLSDANSQIFIDHIVLDFLRTVIKNCKIITIDIIVVIISLSK